MSISIQFAVPTPEQFLAMLRAAPDSVVVDIRRELERGDAAPPVAAPPVAAPTAANYRIDPTLFNLSVCIARDLDDREDKRWQPAVYSEAQCSGKVVEGSDLCAKCIKREAKYAADPKPGKWCGRITEEPFDWQHMLGTVWAEKKANKGAGVKWLGGHLPE